MVFTLVPALADTNTMVYVSVSKYGEFVTDENGYTLSSVPVKLDADSPSDINSVLSELHDTYCPGGYESAEGDYGAYITKLWGDESGNFGYQVNGGTESVMGLTHEIEDGDYLDVTIYQSMYPETESYTKFDTYKKEVFAGEEFEISLSQAGYDENWNTVFSPCEGATITINGKATDVNTDSHGKVALTLDAEGIYTISACKTKESGEKTVTAITAPVCTVTVNAPQHITAMGNIVNYYRQNGISSDENMVWLIADMAVYSELFPEDEFTLSKKERQKCIDKTISDSQKSSVPSVLAKNILALRAFGYDAKDTYTSKSKKLDIVDKLSKLIDEQSDAVTNVYTLPYVIIALRQSEDYATDEQMEYLINSAISSKEIWLNDEWGTDAASAMVFALAPYYNSDDAVKSAIDEAVDMIKSAQDDTGLINNAASTGLAITALSALGIDPQTVICNGKNLVDGLMTQANETLSGFEPMTNTFSTEQGFRGLVAWQLAKAESGKAMYDFSSYPLDTAKSTKTKTSSSSGGTIVTVVPDTNTEKVEQEEKTEDFKNENINPDINVKPVSYAGKTFEDISTHKNKIKIEALAERNIINGKSETSFDPDGTITRSEFAAIITRGLGLPQKASTMFEDVKSNDWFYESVNTAYHYGIIKGVSATEFNPYGNISRQEAATMVSRAAKLCGISVDKDDDSARDILAVFTDYTKSADWAKSALAFCYENGILSNEKEEIKPEEKITRAEVAEMIYNMLYKSGLIK